MHRCLRLAGDWDSDDESFSELKQNLDLFWVQQDSLVKLLHLHSRERGLIMIVRLGMGWETYMISFWVPRFSRRPDLGPSLYTHTVIPSRSFTRKIQVHYAFIPN